MSTEIPRYIPDEKEIGKYEDSPFSIEDHLKNYCDTNRKIFLDYKANLVSQMKTALDEGKKTCVIIECCKGDNITKQTLNERLGFWKLNAIGSFLYDIRKSGYPFTDDTQLINGYYDERDGYSVTVTRTITIGLGNTATIDTK